MRRGLVSVLLGVSVSATAVFAEPAASRRPPRVCKPAGGVLFEIDQRAVPRTKRMTATTRLYGNGSWKTVVLDVDGKVARTESGCLETTQLDRIHAELRSAPFTTTRTSTVCRTDQARFTVYKRSGKTVYTERTCNVLVLDEDSRDVVDIITTLLGVPGDLDGASRPRFRSSSLPQGCLDNPLARGCD